MQRPIKRLLFSSVLICSAVGLASADNIYLRDGQSVHGTFLGGTARQVRFEVDGQVRTYDVGLIQSLTFNDPEPVAPPSVSTAAPPPPPSTPVTPPAVPAVPAIAAARPAQPTYAGGTTIPADTTITVRMIDSVNSETSHLGQTFQASLDEPIVINGRTVVNRGADVQTKLVDDQQAGKLQGKTVQTLALVSIKVNGRWVDLTSDDVRTESNSQGAKSAKIVGGTAVLGAILGGIAGGGKGAAIGTVSGAAVGAGAAAVTSGQKVVIPSETRLTFRLQNATQLP